MFLQGFISFRASLRNIHTCFTDFFKFCENKVFPSYTHQMLTERNCHTRDMFWKKVRFLKQLTSNTSNPYMISDAGHGNLWPKTRAAWKYVYENHFNDADWFIKTDDDTYLVLENLRYFLSKYEHNEPHYFGRYFTIEGGFNSGGAAYVFSKKTLSDFYELMKDSEKCSPNNPNEDVAVGVCLRNEPTETLPGDTRDEYGRETFHPLKPLEHFNLPNNSWLHSYDKWENRNGKECCSDRSISFHYVSGKEMYVMDYLVYDFQTA